MIHHFLAVSTKGWWAFSVLSLSLILVHSDLGGRSIQGVYMSSLNRCVEWRTPASQCDGGWAGCDGSAQCILPRR